MELSVNELLNVFTLRGGEAQTALTDLYRHGEMNTERQDYYLKDQENKRKILCEKISLMIEAAQELHTARKKGK